MTEEDYSQELKQIPKPDVPHIRVIEIRKISVPHPYCITPKHIAYASDHYYGILNKSAIEEAEKHGAKCDICRKINRKYGKPIVPYDEHITQKTLFIEVPQNRDLNAIEGLNAYLMKIKPTLESLNIEGIAFPTFSKG